MPICQSITKRVKNVLSPKNIVLFVAYVNEKHTTEKKCKHQSEKLKARQSTAQSLRVVQVSAIIIRNIHFDKHNFTIDATFEVPLASAVVSYLYTGVLEVDRFGAVSCNVYSIFVNVKNMIITSDQRSYVKLLHPLQVIIYC